MKTICMLLVARSHSVTLDKIYQYNSQTNEWKDVGSLPTVKSYAGFGISNNRIHILCGGGYSNRVFAADLPAPAMNLYFKEGNATSEAELSTLGMADESVTLPGNWHRMPWPRLDWIITQQPRRVACSPSPVVSNHPEGTLCTNAPTPEWFPRMGRKGTN